MNPRSLLCLVGPILLAMLLLPAAARAGLDVYPPGPADFGLVPVGGSLMLDQLIEVHGSEPDSMNITVVPPEAPLEIIFGGGLIHMQSTAIYAVRVAFAPTAAGDFTAELDLGFGHGSVALSGSAAVDFPDCGLSTDGILFPGGHRYEMSLQYLTITNDGAGPLDLAPRVLEYNSAFSVDGQSVAVAPGESYELELRYTPYTPIGQIGALDLGTDACPSIQIVGEVCGYLECEDDVALYFEDPSWQATAKSPVGWPAGYASIDERESLVGHLVLRNPSRGGYITGFQMTMETDPELWLASTEFPGGGMNHAGGTDFQVVFPSPLEVDTGVTLATFTFLAALDTEEAVVRLVPYSPAPGSVAAQRSYATTTGSASFTPASGFDPVAWVTINSIADVPQPPPHRATGLRANVPNPFNPSTEIRWVLATAGPCRLTVHDVAGRLVRVLSDEPRGAGPHSLSWNGRDDASRTLASGVYYVHLVAGSTRDTRKVTLLK